MTTALTLWVLLSSLATIPRQDTRLEQLSQMLGGARFDVKQANEYWTHYRSTPITLNAPAVTLIAYPSHKNETPRMGKLYLMIEPPRGIRFAQVKQYYPDLQLWMPANDPAPLAETTWTAQINGTTVGFGFRNDSPDLLASISIQFP